MVFEEIFHHKRLSNLQYVTIYYYIKRKKLALDYGDVWQSVWSSIARSILHRIDRKGLEERNWRPNIILFSGGSHQRPHLIQFGKDMVARGSGKIIFTASLLTFQGGITVPGYAASKGGIGQLTMALANEWAGKGVNVNAIAPGYIATDNTAALQADPVRNPAILSRIPAGRWGDPDDFKGPIVFLASEAASYMHGTIVTVDGGWMGR